MKISQTALIVSTLMTAISAHADIIRQQKFDAMSLKQRREAVGLVYRSKNPTDLGFTHKGRVSTTEGGFVGVAKGLFAVSHYSNSSKESTLMPNENRRTGRIVFDKVSLGASGGNKFSMSVGNLGSPDGNDHIVVRLKLNGGRFVELLDTRSQRKGLIRNGLLSYEFKDGDSTAQLLVDIATDDLNDGYVIDNIVFEKSGSTAEERTVKKVKAEDPGAVILEIGGIRVLLRDQ